MFYGDPFPKRSQGWAVSAVLLTSALCFFVSQRAVVQIKPLRQTQSVKAIFPVMESLTLHIYAPTMHLVPFQLP